MSITVLVICLIVHFHHFVYLLACLCTLSLLRTKWLLHFYRVFIKFHKKLNAYFFVHVPGFNRKINQCPKDEVYSRVFCKYKNKKSLENVMFNIAAIKLNDQIVPINIEHIRSYLPYVHRPQYSTLFLNFFILCLQKRQFIYLLDIIWFSIK